MTTENTDTTTNADELLPEGWYSARAKSWDWTSTQSGDPMLNITYEITEGPHQGAEAHGRLVFMVSTGQHMDKRAADLRTLGFEGEDSTEIQGPNTGGLDRNVVRVVIKHNEFKGRVYANVDAISAPKQREAKPVDAGTMRRASALLKGALLAHDKKTGTTPTARSTQTAARAATPPRQQPPRAQPDYGPSAGEDDQIPF